MSEEEPDLYPTTDTRSPEGPLAGIPLSSGSSLPVNAKQLSAMFVLATSQIAPGAIAPAVAALTGAQPASEKDGKDKDAKKVEEPIVTQHEVIIGGEKIAYTATTGQLPLLDDEGKVKAKIFFVAYTKDGVADLAERPIMFAFNGGPGSSSVWLHMGALGPKRVKLGDEGEAVAPPGSYVDNEYSWLDLTDLVFIDPVTTGYSRAVEGESDKQFHGLNEDIRAVGSFIRLYATRYKRWGSPKYLAGESYGTTRAAGLATHLQDQLGMFLNGIVLVSPVLNFQTLSFDTGNDLGYPLFLPTYTATAWHHRKLPPNLQADFRRAVQESEAFAGGDYVVALARGDELSPAEQAALADRLASLTGLSREFIVRAKFRVKPFHFMKELLRTEGRTVGRLDSRFTGIDRDGVGANPDYDASYPVIQGPYTSALNRYVREDLKFESDLNYEILTGRVQPWSYASHQNRYAETAESLRGAMTKNPSLRVLVTSGYFDLATPHFAARYTMNHLGLDPSLRANIGQTHYGAGHMMYIRVEDLKNLKADVATFMGGGMPSR